MNVFGKVEQAIVEQYSQLSTQLNDGIQQLSKTKDVNQKTVNVAKTDVMQMFKSIRDYIDQQEQKVLTQVWHILV